ncbi:MAG: M13 family metallopeptidase [Ferruginibacter sp.]
MKYIKFLAPFAIALTYISCSNADKATAPIAGISFFDKTGMDTTVKPGDNLFLYANGRWMNSQVIPDDLSGWGSFYTLYESNLKNLETILADVSKSGNQKGSLEQKVGDYFASGMDTVSINKIGGEPLKPVLAKIDAVKNYKELTELLTEFFTKGDGKLIGFYVGADEKSNTINIPNFYQSGLSLPEKEYYTRKDSATTAARNALIKYAAIMLRLTGSDSVTANKEAQSILSLETEIAKSHRTPVELRDPQSNYNKMSLADLEKQSPNISWRNLFQKMNVRVDSVNVSQPGYYKALSLLLASQPITVWKSKIKFDFISTNASLISKDFTNASFEFNKIFGGQKKEEERWKKIVNKVDNGLGELLGQLYVKKYFTDSAKKRMDELVNNLQKAFKNRIRKLDWMSDTTRQKALAKLNTFLKKIGYPSKWKTFDDVVIDRNNFFANAQVIKEHNQKEMVDKIGKPVDRTEWGMSPPTVNAYYNPTNNEIVFPAGILQAPFFDVKADDAINYGGIGMVIGHEMTHGFDDQGSQYDDVGNMKNWWKKQDVDQFKSKIASVVDQYNTFTVFDSMHVNGQLTLGENLADIGGLAIAYDAFKMTAQGKGTETIDGFTPDQRFFLGFAQVWRLKDRDESMRVRLTTDPHSPEMYRVNGPAANFDPFYPAFNVKEGDKMYIKPVKRAHIW